jgi:hypothetical protein
MNFPALSNVQNIRKPKNDHEIRKASFAGCVLGRDRDRRGGWHLHGFEGHRIRLSRDLCTYSSSILPGGLRAR